MTLKVHSPSFASGETIPQKHTCDGANVSPMITWSEPPAGTQSIALIADDPDAPGGTWVHWAIFNIPAESSGLTEGVQPLPELPNATRQGVTDFRKVGYGGPCPPPGKPHRYFFKVYALDTMLDLKAGAMKLDLERAMQGHILARGELMGRYAR